MSPILFLIAGMAMAAPSVKWPEVPLSFEPNMGQAAAHVRYLARDNSYALYMACGETLLYGKGSPLRTQLPGADPSCRITGEAPQASTSNYFVGRDPGKWHTSIPNFAKVRVLGRIPRNRSHLLRQGRAPGIRLDRLAWRRCRRDPHDV